jgi:uncharacterized protein YecE (DUF72 family)
MAINARETATLCPPPLHIGCAGWAITKAADGRFPDHGTSLERYAQQLPAVEINSTFYRPHRPTTYRRWAASTPPSFRFAVKAPRSITHDARLTNVEPELGRFLDEIQNLGDRLGPVLIQLPPSLAFDSPSVHLTFAQLRQRFSGPVVCEPRHESWLSPAALTALSHFGIPLVQADPAIVDSCVPHITDGPVAYHRLHGSPRMYYSSYDGEFLSRLAGQIANELACHREVWCIFDNTAAGAAIENAFELLAMVEGLNVSWTRV